MTIRDIFKRIAREKGWSEERIDQAMKHASLNVTSAAVDREIAARPDLGLTKEQVEEETYKAMLETHMIMESLSPISRKAIMFAASQRAKQLNKKN